MFRKKNVPKELLEDKKRSKYVRNVQRLKEYYENGNLKGVNFICRYLEQNGIDPPNTYKACDKLIQRLNDVE